MTPEQLEAIRERAALRIDCHRDPIDGEWADEDRTALLAYVDTLKLRVGVQGRLIKMLSRRRAEQTFTAANLLAHQQARGSETREEEAQGIKDYLDLRDHADAQSVRAQSAEAERDTLRAELARKDAEIERLKAIARDWLDVMEADEADCTCEGDDICPLCRCRAALGKEVREHERREQAEREGRS